MACFLLTTSSEEGEQVSSFALRPNDDVAKGHCRGAMSHDGASFRKYRVTSRFIVGPFTKYTKSTKLE